MAALAADGAIDEEGLSGVELQNTFGPLSQQVNESLAKQAEVMSNIQVRRPDCHSSLCWCPQLEPVLIPHLCGNVW